MVWYNVHIFVIKLLFNVLICTPPSLLFYRPLSRSPGIDAHPGRGLGLAVRADRQVRDWLERRGGENEGGEEIMSCCCGGVRFGDYIDLFVRNEMRIN